MDSALLGRPRIPVDGRPTHRRRVDPGSAGAGISACRSRVAGIAAWGWRVPQRRQSEIDGGLIARPCFRPTVDRQSGADAHTPARNARNQAWVNGRPWCLKRRLILSLLFGSGWVVEPSRSSQTVLDSQGRNGWLPIDNSSVRRRCSTETANSVDDELLGVRRAASDAVDALQGVDRGGISGGGT